MAESILNIFGNIQRQSVKNVSRQPLSNIENIGKTVSSGPIKLNEPVKKIGDNKKSFLSNTGKALHSTPARQVFTPTAVNIGALIYTDTTNETDNRCPFEDLEFTKPLNKYDNYHRDLLDFLPLPEPKALEDNSPPPTPPPKLTQYSLELDCSYEDEFFTDDFSCSSINGDDDLDLPAIY